jgi:hypothetical protein
VATQEQPDLNRDYYFRWSSVQTYHYCWWMDRESRCYFAPNQEILTLDLVPVMKDLTLASKFGPIMIERAVNVYRRSGQGRLNMPFITTMQLMKRWSD